jgi:Leu/Phe-tRNA-protein transferase
MGSFMIIYNFLYRNYSTLRGSLLRPPKTVTRLRDFKIGFQLRRVRRPFNADFSVDSCISAIMSACKGRRPHGTATIKNK